jgi:hypothetical protein
VRSVLIAGSVLAASGAFVLPRPPFPAPVEGNGTGRLKLALVSSEPNHITDERAWFRHNGLRVPAPTKLNISGNVVVTPRYSFDFRKYAYAAVTAPGEREFLKQEIVSAVEAGGVLYVETAHSTYARSSGYRNAYITAIGVKSRKLLWRSPALVANGKTFQVLGSVLVSGYGFTDEPDYLFLLDRRTGKLVDRLALPSGPEYVLRKGGRLYVRTYDHDVVAKLYRP